VQTEHGDRHHWSCGRNFSRCDTVGVFGADANPATDVAGDPASLAPASDVADGGALVSDSQADLSAIDLKDKGTLTVCADIPYPPFAFYENEENKKLIGIDVDLVRAIAKRLDLQPTFVSTSFDTIFPSLAAGKCDLIASATAITEERKQINDFTNPYFTVRQSMLVRATDAGLNDVTTLSGKVVGVASASNGAVFAQEVAKINGYTVKEFPGEDELVGALTAGRIDVVISDAPLNGYAALQSAGSLIVSKVFEKKNEEYGFVVPKTNSALTVALNANIEALKANGGYQEILTKYIG
jgi:polar amino acid transport system substrate-binding protein